MPGPASTVGDRPPTNSAIRVRFPLQETVVRNTPWIYLFRRERHTSRTLSLTETSDIRTCQSITQPRKRSQRHLLDWKAVFKSSLYERGTWPCKIGPYSTTIFYNTTLATWSGISTRLSLRLEPSEMTEEQCLRPRNGITEKEDYRLVSRTWDTPWNRGCPG